MFVTAVTPASQEQFVSVAAQIIPVLLLALVADPVARKKKHGNANITMLSALVAGVLGEALVLTSIYAGSEGWGDGTIASCMAVIGYAIVKPHSLVYWKRMVSSFNGSTQWALGRMLLIPIFIYYFLWLPTTSLPVAIIWLIYALLVAMTVGALLIWLGKRRTERLEKAAAGEEAPDAGQDADEPSVGREESTDGQEQGEEQGAEREAHQ